MTTFTAYRVQIIEQNTKKILTNGALNLVTESLLTISSRRRCDTPATNSWIRRILGPPYLFERNPSGGLSDG